MAAASGDLVLVRNNAQPFDILPVGVVTNTTGTGVVQVLVGDVVIDLDTTIADACVLAYSGLNVAEYVDLIANATIGSPLIKLRTGWLYFGTAALPDATSYLLLVDPETGRTYARRASLSSVIADSLLSGAIFSATTQRLFACATGDGATPGFGRAREVLTQTVSNDLTTVDGVTVNGRTTDQFLGLFSSFDFLVTLGWTWADGGEPANAYPTSIALGAPVYIPASTVSSAPPTDFASADGVQYVVTGYLQLEHLGSSFGPALRVARADDIGGDQFYALTGRLMPGTIPT